MTAAEDRREELEAVIRQKVGGAYRYGLMLMSMQASSPLGYPEENRDTDAILAAADAYAEASRERAPHEPRPTKPPAVHYAAGGSQRPACVPGGSTHGRRYWDVTTDRGSVTCGNCRRSVPWREAGEPP